MVKLAQAETKERAPETTAEEMARELLSNRMPVKQGRPIRKDRFCGNLKEEGLSCPICLELMVRPVLTQCGHAFCLSCIDDFFLRASRHKDTVSVRCCVCRKGVQFYDYNESASLRGMVALYIRKQASEGERNSYQRRMGQLEHTQATRTFIPLRLKQPLDVFYDDRWGSAYIVAIDVQACFDSSSCDAAFETTITLEADTQGPRRKRRWEVSAGSRKIASHRFFSGEGMLRL